MLSFHHITPPLRLFHGVDSMEMLGPELDRIGSRRAVVICGRSVSSDASVMALLRSAMQERCAGVFDGVRAHSPLPSVQQAAQMLAALEADAVVSVGGGSAIVTGRAAAILLAEGGHAHALCTQRDADGRMRSPRLLKPKLPQFVVPTTPTTACVKAGSAVFDPEHEMRLAMFDPKTRAQALFIHPLLVMSAPSSLVLSASLNAVSMAVEGLESASGDPLSDALLMQALRLFGQRLPGLEAGGDAALRGDLILAAMLCGQGTDYAGGGIASVLGHAIGARCLVENGVANAIMLPHTMRFNASATKGRLHKIALALCGASGLAGGGGKKDPESEAAVNAVVGLLARLRVPSRLRDVAVPRAAFPAIAEAAMSDWFLQKNPRPVLEARALIEVLEAAW